MSGRAGDVVVALDDVSFTYRGGVAPALRGVSLSVRRGELVVVMGATGAGKSTLARCITRGIPQFQPGVLSGRIEVLGRDVGAATVSDLAGTVGLVSQDFEAQLFSTSVRHEVAFGMEQLGVPRAEMARRLGDALAVVGLAGFDGRDPITLSGGEKQRLAIAALLALAPAVLVFDEPTTDLDPLGRDEVFAALAAVRARGATILLIEHETAAAERADRLVLMAGGAIVADGAPAALLADVDRLERLGVRPLDLDRLTRARGWTARPADVAAAAARLVADPRAVAPPAPAFAPAVGPPLLDAEGLVHAYAPGRAALAGVSLAVAAGEFVAVIGHNGSGKTTLAKCLNGLLTPQQGRVRLRGRDLRALPAARVAAEVGYVFQDPDQQIFAATVGEEVGFALANLGVPDAEAARRVAAVLDAVGLAGCEARDPFLLGKGQRQRLAVASLLVLEPALLILDEPTTGLDYREQRHLMGLLADLHRRGLAVVVITHSPWLVAEYAQRGVVLRDGRVVFDGPLRALCAEEALLEASRFRLPDATRIGRRLGFTPLSVAELLASVEPGNGG